MFLKKIIAEKIKPCIVLNWSVNTNLGALIMDLLTVKLVDTANKYHFPIKKLNFKNFNHCIEKVNCLKIILSIYSLIKIWKHDMISFIVRLLSFLSAMDGIMFSFKISFYGTYLTFTTFWLKVGIGIGWNWNMVGIGMWYKLPIKTARVFFEY